MSVTRHSGATITVWWGNGSQLHTMFGYSLSMDDEEIMDILGISTESPVWGLVEVARQRACE